MASKKDNLPLKVDMDTEQTSNITYANEVVASIAGVAASEVEGIASMCNVSGSILSKKNSNITKGVKVEIGTEEASVDLYVTVEYGKPIQKAAHEVQEAVRKAIEEMTGLHVVRVDVHVQGVSFEKEQKALAGMEELPGLNKTEEAPKAAEAPKIEKPEGCAIIGFDDFMKVELRTAQITECEPVPKAKKLLKLKVDLGYETRQVVSGIAKFYKPEDLIGKKIILVANLAPAKLCGVESEGMLLASGEEEVRVVFLAEDTPLGERVR